MPTTAAVPIDEPCMRTVMTGPYKTPRYCGRTSTRVERTDDGRVIGYYCTRHAVKEGR